MNFSTQNGTISVDLNSTIVAGWTGRSRASVDHHIKELEEIGIAPPSKVPLFYRVSSDLLTQNKTIQVLGPHSSGEAEPIVICFNGTNWLGLASDHTDRKLESYSIAYSKQACPKPIADTLWEFADVESHLDKIVLRSWIFVKDWELYQEGFLSAILPLKELIDAVGLNDNSAMLCGTLPAIGGIQYSDRFRMELVDPVLERKIEWSYTVVNLPIVS